ncbi:MULTISPECIES: class I SAM-dependent methyltransferase [Cellvibrio]|uniref:Methyltransferase n=1 Tax=Cellvibrio fibrivorans TaxID=126350 RepID=A0ABU1UT84_9GAMM|nr:methyltransferase domain-containing protein [Cellvibrio fibrivorans]MDR7088391.1 putative methyltransferase [Cellvibrio fibrivorans]
MKRIAFLTAAILLQSCSSVVDHKQTATLSDADKKQLVTVTQSLPAEHQARYAARHPVETLEFFGIKQGDTVVEALPGEGWYSKILLPYLGAEGRLIAVDYSLNMWPEFGGFATPEFIAQRKAWPAQFAVDAKTWGGANGAKGEAYTFANMPAELTGKVDAVLFIRALHNLARFDAKGNYLKQALAETHRVLKPGGVVGIVQHAMSEDKPDAWADGSRGYLKRSYVISAMTAAGFEFVGESDINKNPKDDPQADDNVWRLPPSLSGTEEQKAKNRLIGESNRITLLFRKK